MDVCLLKQASGCFNIWITRYLDYSLSRQLVFWTTRFQDNSLSGLLVIWTTRYLEISFSGNLVFWKTRYLDYSLSGLLVIRTTRYLDNSLSGQLVIWTFCTDNETRRSWLSGLNKCSDIRSLVITMWRFMSRLIHPLTCPALNKETSRFDGQTQKNSSSMFKAHNFQSKNVYDDLLRLYKERKKV